jgi:hypothetical protein
MAGGTVVSATSCEPNPCGSGAVACCIPGSASGSFVGDDGDDDHGGAACKELTTQQCATAGGTVVPGTSCEAHPCAPVRPPNATACCVPQQDDDAACEILTPDQCAAVHGTPSDATSCGSDPCGGQGDQGDDSNGQGDNSQGDE